MLTKRRTVIKVNRTTLLSEYEFTTKHNNKITISYCNITIYVFTDL